MKAGGRRLEVWRMAGLTKYEQALRLQDELVEKRRTGAVPDTLLSLQHPPIFTLGKRRTFHNILSTPETLRSIGAGLHETDRGGDVTFHGPHQAVLYPVLCLRESKLGARRYVEGLEDTMIRLASLYGVQAKGRLKGETGVWVENRKLGAVGVRISSGSISSHGLAFNIDPDLSYFSHIIPCGIPLKSVTSLRLETSQHLPEEDVITQQLIESFIDVLSFDEITWKDVQ